MLRATIFASFADDQDAEKAAGALLDNGIAAEDISLVAPRRTGTVDVAEHDRAVVQLNERMGTAFVSPLVHEMAPAMSRSEDPFDTISSKANGFEMAGGIPSTDAATDYRQNLHQEPIDRPTITAKTGISTTTGGDAEVGAVKGAATGMGLGLAAALAAVFIPGVGLVLGAGTLAAALIATAAATGAGAIAGGVTGFLKDQGVPAEAATVYHDAFEKGGTILAVNLPMTVKRADIEAILAKYGAQNIDQYGEVRVA